MTEETVQPLIEFKNVSLDYGETKVLKKVDLEIEEGKFYTLLGPSGSGKSTILSLISGRLQPTGGDILIEGKNVNSLPSNQRKVNTVFQNYALFPNMNVYDNVAFGPSIKGFSKKRSIN